MVKTVKIRRIKSLVSKLCNSLGEAIIVGKLIRRGDQRGEVEERPAAEFAAALKNEKYDHVTLRRGLVEKVSPGHQYQTGNTIYYLDSASYRGAPVMTVWVAVFATDPAEKVTKKRATTGPSRVEVAQAHAAAISAAKVAFKLEKKEAIDSADVRGTTAYVHGYGCIHLNVFGCNRRGAKYLLAHLEDVSASHRGGKDAIMPTCRYGDYMCKLRAHQAYAKAIRESLGVRVHVRTYD